jgi:hypothetical protein
MAGAIVVLGVATGVLQPCLAQALPYLLPPLLLALALVMRLYPGERALLRLMDRRRTRLRWARDTGAAGRSQPRAVVPRGGRLIASSLAVRPPPTPASVVLS